MRRRRDGAGRAGLRLLQLQQRLRRRDWRLLLRLEVRVQAGRVVNGADQVRVLLAGLHRRRRPRHGRLRHLL
jgi:hypothetical protein